MTRSIPPLEETVATWYCSTTDAALIARQDAFLELLSDDERARYDRFALPNVKWEFLLAHAMLRLTLSQFSTTPPQSWSFQTEGNGKPRLSQSHAENLEFNISHTRGWVAVSVSQNWKVGVDVQHIRERSVKDLSNYVLAPWEVDYLEADSADAHQDFFRFWTLKEAYLKTTGVGLSKQLKAFGFELRADSPRLRFADPGEADSAPFHCLEHVPADEVKMAVGSLGGPRPRFHFEYFSL